MSARAPGHEREQRALLDNIPDQAWLKDAQCRYLAVNPAYLAALGRTEGEVLGRTPREVWPPEIAAVYLRTDHAVMRSGQRHRYEETRPDSGGRSRWFETIKAPIRDASGRVVGTVGISRDISERKAAEDALVSSRTQLRALSHHLQTVREEERARIARELHDELGQTLTAMKLDLGWLRQHLPAEGEGLRLRLERLIGLVDRSVTDLHRISADLRPLMLDELGLPAAIRWLTETVANRSGIDLRLAIGCTEGSHGGEVDTAAFRIIQEALTNIVRHSGARHAEIRVSQGGGALRIEVSDDGCGPPGSSAAPGGHGLVGMHERAAMLGGSVTIDAAPGGGTVVRARLPLPGGPDASAPAPSGPSGGARP